MGKRAKASRANDQDTLSSRRSGRGRRKGDTRIRSIGTEGGKRRGGEGRGNRERIPSTRESGG